MNESISKKVNKTVLITGASQGLGASLCRALSAEGYSLILVSRQKDKLKKLSQDLPSPSFILPLDLQNPFEETEVQQINYFLEEQKSLLYGLIHNAGIYIKKPWNRFTLQEKKDLFQVNFWSIIQITETLAPLLKKNKTQKGRILIIGSSLVHKPVAETSLYRASKAALSAWSESLALELAPHINVNILHPGIINTPIHSFFGEEPNSEQIKQINQLHPLERMGQPEDISTWASFLLKEDTNWVTGSQFTVDGGLSLR